MKLFFVAAIALCASLSYSAAINKCHCKPLKIEQQCNDPNVCTTGRIDYFKLHGPEKCDAATFHCYTPKGLVGLTVLENNYYKKYCSIGVDVLGRPIFRSNCLHHVSKAYLDGLRQRDASLPVQGNFTDIVDETEVIHNDELVESTADDKSKVENENLGSFFSLSEGDKQRSKRELLKTSYGTDYHSVTTILCHNGEWVLSPDYNNLRITSVACYSKNFIVDDVMLFSKIVQ